MKKETIVLGWFILAYVFNVADVIFTLYAILHGHYEMNPIMAYALEISPVFFVAVKLIVFGLAIQYLAKRADYLLSYTAIFYAFVMIWHLHHWVPLWMSIP